MPYIYSTASTGFIFYLGAQKIDIKGGANVSNKHLWTPKGVVTKVTDAELEGLKKNKVFNKLVNTGYFKLAKIKWDADRIAKDMEGPDRASQITKEELKGDKKDEKEPLIKPQENDKEPLDKGKEKKGK